MEDDTLMREMPGDELEDEDTLKKPRQRLLAGGGDEGEPDARVKQIKFAKQGGSAKATRKSRAAAKLAAGDDNAATELVSNLSINGRRQGVDAMSLEPGQRRKLKQNQDRGQTNYYGREIAFDQTQLHLDGKARGKIQAEPKPIIEIEEMTDERMEANRFKEFAHLFENLTVETRFITEKKSVVNVIITNDATKVLALV